MTIHVLLINRQLVFAVTIKQALEQTGAFEVHPFTSADPAVEYLRTHPHEVALVDFTLPDGPKIVQRLRELQPEIAVIVSPNQPNANILIRDLGLQGIIDAPFSARSIIPLIEHAVEQITQPSAAVTRNLPGAEEDTSGETEILPGEGRDQKPSPTGSGTRILQDKQLPPVSPQTRILDEDQPPGKMKSASGGRRTINLTPPPPPPSVPEFSSLDDVLSEEAPFDLEPPAGEGDTPSVPVVDSDAVRQFLATKPPASDATFGNLLGTIDPSKEADKPAKPNTFDDLVNSMRGQQQPQTALPDRHQQFIDFILTGGMENLLTEIEKNKTGPLSDPDEEDSSTFEKLAQEEPPMPTLEESGTVGDLMLGVSDTSFRNVLAMMSGDENAVVEESQSGPGLSKEMEEAFAAFFEQQVEKEPPFIDETEKPAPKPVKRLKPQKSDDSGSIPAQLILETTQDDSTPAESFSLNTLIVSIERQLSEHTPDVQALPSWGKDIKLQRRRKVDDRYIKEPDFLPEEGFTSQMIPITPAPPETVDEPVEEFPFEPGFLAEQEALSAADQKPVLDSTLTPSSTPPVTLPNWDDIAEWDVEKPDIDEEALEELDDWGDVTVLGEAVSSEVEEVEWNDEPPAQEPVPDDVPDRPMLGHDFFMNIDESPEEHTVILQRPEPEVADIPPAQPIELTPVQEEDEPYIAQIALSLTQVSLELTADATLLTRGEELVAYAGSLMEDDIEEFRLAVGDEWKAEGDEARIRFLRLGSSGKDYMLYSRKTAGDFTLSMIFSTTTPLRDIRRQGKRLMEALESVPEELPPTPVTLNAEQQSPEDAIVPIDMGSSDAPPETLTPFAYVWLANTPLSENSTRTIETGLPMQLRALGWQIRSVEAQDEYVYVLADVPGEQPAHEVVRDLKRRTAALVLMQTPEAALSWTPGYLVMTPGRPLEPDEIEQFIRFERLQ